MPVGATPRGTRQYIPSPAGASKGHASGQVLPGGWDWQLIRPDGHIDIDASYFIQADDGAVIHIHNRGTLFRRAEGVYDIKTFVNFEGASGPAPVAQQSTALSAPWAARRPVKAGRAHPLFRIK